MRQQMSDEEVENIKRDLYIDLIFDVLILILVVHFGKNASCGIPIFMWTLIYFALLGAKSLSNLIKIVIIRNFADILNRYSILSYVIIDGTFIAWLIYGNMLFYSSKNNCF